MHKVVFAAALAVGLITAPMSQFVSSAAAQQVSAEKNAKMKKEPSAGQLATRERQKKCGAEWKEAKASNKIEKRNDVAKILERLQQASQVRRQLTLDIASTRAHKSLRIKRLRASARLKSRRRPLCHPNRGAAGNRIALITP
jgi:hypothetical protein